VKIFDENISIYSCSSSDCVIYQNLPILLYVTVIKLISNIISNCFEHPAYLNSGKNDVEAYIYRVLGKIIVVHHQKFQDLNINKSYFCKFDGIRRNFN
jgi:hypothetical protein